MNKNLLLPWRYFFIAILLCCFNSASAQGNDSKGTDFWLTFPGNLGTPTVTLFITGDENTTGNISFLGNNLPFNVTGGAITTVNLPTTVLINTSNTVASNGVHITAGKEITIYGLNRIQATTDAFLALPTDILGTSYINLGYKNSVVNGTQFAVVATQDATTVTITPTVATDGRAAGVPYNIVLNQGQTYMLRNTASSTDLSGSIITSTKPIAVFGSQQCANIPPGVTFCDYIVEQLPPTTAWGRNFISVPLKTRTRGDTFRFLASNDNTTVRVNGAVVATLDKGEFFETILTASSQITSDKAILVAQYSNGTSFDNVTSDPFMMLIPPFEQFLGNYTFATPSSGFRINFVNVVAPQAAVGSLRLDGVVIPAASFTNIGSTGFAGAQIDIGLGTHTINGSTLPFGIFVYGFDNFDSYGYPGGQSISEVASVTSIAISPKTGTSPVNVEKCWIALVRDQNSRPVAGVRVDFAITGSNTSSGFAFTGADGRAQFCFTGTNGGADNIKASVGALTDNATFTWTTTTTPNVYYSKATGDLHNVLTWGLNPDGSGPNPPDFGAGKTFNLANRTTFYNLTADWTVGGILNYTNSGDRLVINGKTLSIVSLNGAGTITGSMTSNLILNGNDAGQAPAVRFTTGAGSALNMLKVNRTGTNGSIGIGTPLNIYGVLEIAAGKLMTGNMLTLKSNATSTARVAPVMGTIDGTVTVERYIPARRAWRLMNAPVTGTQTINDAWQEGATTSSAVVNPNPGYGTYITIGSVANGFDQNAGSTASILQYNNTTDTWNPLANTNATTVGTKPFMLFVRGHRGMARPLTAFQAPTVTTLRAQGNLNVGDKTYPVDETGFTAVPNPFASPINFATITRNNVPNNFYLWDPKLGGKYGVGGYVNVSFNGVSYDVTPAAVSPMSQYIQSGQSFLVQSSGAPGSVTIKESDKTATPAQNVFRANPNETPVDNSQGIRINLQSIDEEGAAILDEVYSSYSVNYSTTVDKLDAIKFPNMQENLSIVRGGTELMVDRRAPVTDGDILELKLNNTTSRNYFFEINPINISSMKLYGYIEDRYLNSVTQISLSEISQVHFSVNADLKSADPNRFRILLSGKPMATIVGREERRIQVFPNPVSGSNINLQFFNSEKGMYKAELVNSLGQVVYRRELMHQGGTAVQRLPMDKTLSKGVYQLRLANGTTSSTIKVFVK